MTILFIIIGIYLFSMLLAYRLLALNDKYYLKYCKISNKHINSYNLNFINGKLVHDLNNMPWIPIINILICIYGLGLVIRLYFLYISVKYRKEDSVVRIFGKTFSIKNPFIALWTYWILNRNNS